MRLTEFFSEPRRQRAVFVLLMIVSLGAARAEEPDWTLYGEVLTAHVKPGRLQSIRLNIVDYGTLKRDPRFAQVVEQLAAFSPERLEGKEQQLAYYINAYNILALKTVVDHWPVATIKEIGTLFKPVWKRPAGQLGKETLSLDAIENDRLRPLGDPRIHLAIVCASISCPDLRLEPYTAENLDSQLEDQARTFLDNDGKGLRLKEGIAEVSEIFDWFEKDFAGQGGVKEFVARYHELPADAEVEPGIPYNWSVNGR